jgi:hypothetical protein
MHYFIKTCYYKYTRKKNYILVTKSNLFRFLILGYFKDIIIGRYKRHNTDRVRKVN